MVNQTILSESSRKAADAIAQSSRKAANAIAQSACEAAKATSIMYAAGEVAPRILNLSSFYSEKGFLSAEFRNFSVFSFFLYVAFVNSRSKDKVEKKGHEAAAENVMNFLTIALCICMVAYDEMLSLHRIFLTLTIQPFFQGVLNRFTDRKNGEEDKKDKTIFGVKQQAVETTLAGFFVPTFFYIFVGLCYAQNLSLQGINCTDYNKPICSENTYMAILSLALINAINKAFYQIPEGLLQVIVVTFAEGLDQFLKNLHAYYMSPPTQSTGTEVITRDLSTDVVATALAGLIALAVMEKKNREEINGCLTWSVDRLNDALETAENAANTALEAVKSAAFTARVTSDRSASSAAEGKKRD